MPHEVWRPSLRAAVVALLALAVASCGSARQSIPVQPSEAAATALATPAATSSSAPLDPRLAELTPDGLRVHLDALEAIAREHDGNRSIGTPGFEASADYAERTLAEAGYRVTRQAFEVPVWESPGGNELVIEGDTPATFMDGRDFLPFWYGSAGDAEGTLVVADPCSFASFDGLASGSIVFVPEVAGCGADFTKIAASDASAFIIGSSMPTGSLARYPVPPDLISVPLVVVTSEAGTSLAASAGATVRLRVTGETHQGTTSNLIADLPGSDPDRVVMIGAHLDSVPDGPGIDDDGTGVAVVLELARLLAGAEPAATIRFALWSAEEIGLVGSAHYVNGLTRDERLRIDGYLNADMLGAPNWIRGLYVGAGDLKGTREIATQLRAFFRDRGLPIITLELVNNTDSLPFSQANIATAGLISFNFGVKSEEEAKTFGGVAGQPMDACYHLACDDTKNTDFDFLADMARAYGSTLLSLAAP